MHRDSPFCAHFVPHATLQLMEGLKCGQESIRPGISKPVDPRETTPDRFFCHLRLDVQVTGCL